MELTTEAKSGRLPFTLAVSVVSNKAYVDIHNNTVVEAAGDLYGDAYGTVQTRTISTGTTEMPQTTYGTSTQITDPNASSNTIPSQDSNTLDVGKSGGFFAVSVVDQDVYAAIRENASVTTGGDMNLNAGAHVHAVNEARSNPNEGGNSMTFDQLLKKLCGDGTNTGLLAQIANKFDPTPNPGGGTTPPNTANQRKSSTLNGVLNKLTGQNTGAGKLVNQGTAGATDGSGNSTNSIQLVGSLVVTYVGNQNKSYIDSTGNLTAGGTVGVRASGSIISDTLADGSPVKRTSAGSTGTASGLNATGAKDTFFPGYTYGVVTVPNMNNGTVFISGAPATLDTVNFEAEAVSGYELQSEMSGTGADATKKYFITVSGTTPGAAAQKFYLEIDEERTANHLGGYTVYKLAAAQNPWIAATGDTVNATFVAKELSVSCTNSEPCRHVMVTNGTNSFAATPFADDGKNLYVKVKPNTGYHIVEVKYVVTPASATGGGTTPPEEIAQRLNGAAGTDRDGNAVYLIPGDKVKGNITVTVSFNGASTRLAISPDNLVSGLAKITRTDAATGEVTVIYDNDENTAPPKSTPIGSGQPNPVKVGEPLTLTINMTGVKSGTLQKYILKNSLRFSGSKPIYIKNIVWDEQSLTYTCQFNVPIGDNADDQAVLGWTTTTDKSKAQGTIKNSSTAIAVGVNVAVTNYSNEAYINPHSGTIQAGGLEVSAKTATASSSAIAKSGFTAADLGLAGALTVHVATVNNKAEVKGEGTIVLAEHADLILAATIAMANYLTVADAGGLASATGAPGTATANKTGTNTGGTGSTTGKTNPAASGNPGTVNKQGATNDSVGVGAGIAVGVIGVDSIANIADAILIRMADESKNLGKLDIRASFNGYERMAAKAGASGGTAIVPVLALDVSGVYVNASTGTNLNHTLKFASDVNVNANNSILRTLAADAAAAGSGVGVGGAFVVDVLNDSARANLGRNVSGKNVNVKAKSVSRLNSTAKASAAGTPRSTGTSSGTGTGTGSTSGSGSKAPPAPAGGDSSGDDGGGSDPGSSEDDEPDEDDLGEALQNLYNEGEADQITDKNTAAASGMAGKANTTNVNSTSVSNLTANRQKAQTSEGSVQVAASMVVNVQQNDAVARIADGVVINATGDILVSSANDTDGIISANSAATNSETGVGVGVAINTVFYENIAYVGASHITGNSLTVKAELVESDGKYNLEKLFKKLMDEILEALTVKKFVQAIFETATDVSDGESPQKAMTSMFWVGRRTLWYGLTMMSSADCRQHLRPRQAALTGKDLRTLSRGVLGSHRSRYNLYYRIYQRPHGFGENPRR